MFFLSCLLSVSTKLIKKTHPQHIKVAITVYICIYAAGKEHLVEWESYISPTLISLKSWGFPKPKPTDHQVM